MPYQSVQDLPAYVRRRWRKNLKKQRQWMHVWMSVKKSTGDEGRAFAAANSVTGGHP
jgi:hypothetical protein